MISNWRQRALWVAGGSAQSRHQGWTCSISLVGDPADAAAAINLAGANK
jgi:hypothetical protein